MYRRVYNKGPTYIIVIAQVAMDLWLLVKKPRHQAIISVKRIVSMNRIYVRTLRLK